MTDYVSVLKTRTDTVSVIGPSASAIWLPNNASVPTLLWNRADDAHDDGGGTGEIDIWPDRSGAGDANRNQVPPGAHGSGLRPILLLNDPDYGNKPSVKSNGVQTLGTVGVWSVPPILPLTILVIGKSAANTAYLSGRNALGNLLWQFGNFVQFYNGPSLSLPQPVNTPGVMMFEDDGTASGTASRLFLNDLTNPVVSGATCASGDTGYNIMAGDAGVGPTNGSEAEVVIWGGILSAADKAKLKTYLNTTRAYGLPVV